MLIASKFIFSLEGLVNGIVGPTIPGLQSLISFTMDQMTYIFVIQGLGFIIGVVSAFLLEKQLSTRLIMSVSLLTGCAASGALPWVRNYPYVAVMFFLQSLAKGLVDYAALSICNQLWPNNRGMAFQFVTLGAAIGAFVIPFASRPFLATYVLTSQSHGKCTTGVDSLRRDCIVPGHVEYPYVIMSVLCTPPAVAFMYYFVKRQRSLPLLQDDYERMPTTVMTSSPLKALMTVVLFLLHLPVLSMPLAYGDLLSSYGIRGKWHLSRRHMATMTSVFWGAFLVGRIVNLTLTKYADQFYLLCCNFFGLFMTGIILCTWTSDYEIALWVGSAGLGVFSSPFLPMILTWVSENAGLAGSLISVCLCASGIGEVVVPWVSGWVFGHGGPQALMFLVAGMVVFEIVMFIILVVVVRASRKKRAGSLDDDNVSDT